MGILEKKTKTMDYKVVKFVLEDLDSRNKGKKNQVQGSDRLNELIKCSQRNNLIFFLMVRKDRSIIGRVSVKIRAELHAIAGL